MNDQNNMEFTTEKTDITALPPADRALIVLNSTKTEEHLNALVVEAAPITEVNSPAGRDQAHALGMKMRKARTTIEKTGKTAREDAQAFSRAVIGEEKRLIGIIEGEEKRVLGLRDGYDAQIEAEKAAKAAAEAARIATIQEKIAGIRNLPLALAGEPSEVIEAELQAMVDFNPSELAFAEFTEECAHARREAIGAMRDLANKVKAQEDAAAAALEAKRIADEALAAERAAIEEERAAIARERAEIAAARAAMEAAKPVETETVKMMVPAEVAAAVEADPVGAVKHLADFAEEENAALAHAESVPDATAFVAPWHIRQLALATADQFDALAGKVTACGQVAFGIQLYEVAATVREGQFDAALAGADIETLVAFDNQLIDATVNAVDAVSGAQAAA